MNEHTLRVPDELFKSIASGKKTIESRLYDEKRQAIKTGDSIVFISRADPTQTVTVMVIGLLRYKTFDELFSDNDLTKFNGSSKQWLLDQINEFYSAA